MKKIKSWYEEYRENIETGEALEKERQAARDYEAEWRADNERLHIDDQIMHEYANLLMWPELKALGDYITKKYPAKEDRWIIADAVHNHYGRYFLFNNQPAEAAKWFVKALKNGIPYPYKVWQDLAAAYVESGDYKKADYWIKRYTKYYAAEGRISPSDWMDFAKFYLDIENYERAMALTLEAHPDRNWYHFDKPDIAKIFIGVGEVQQGLAVYENYLLRQQDDDFGFADLALLYYNLLGDVDRAEALYLQSIGAAANREDPKKWNHHIYNNLSIIFANSEIWDKCFHYLRLHYLDKYGAEEADVFLQLIDNRPPDTDELEFSPSVYHTIRAFEESPLRFRAMQEADGLVSQAPGEELGGKSALFGFGELGEN